MIRLLFESISNSNTFSDSELHLSWASDNSMCEQDGTETSIYDSSLEYNHDVD
jgi:hypothetical protein